MSFCTLVLLYALHHLGSAEECQEQRPEQEVQEIQELNEEHHDLDTNLPECPDHQPSTFTQGKPRSILKSPCFIINLLEYFILCCIKCQELYESQIDALPSLILFTHLVTLLIKVKTTA